MKIVKKKRELVSFNIRIDLKAKSTARNNNGQFINVKDSNNNILQY